MNLRCSASYALASCDSNTRSSFSVSTGTTYGQSWCGCTLYNSTRGSRPWIFISRYCFKVRGKRASGDNTWCALEAAATGIRYCAGRVR